MIRYGQLANLPMHWRCGLRLRRITPRTTAERQRSLRLRHSAIRTGHTPRLTGISSATTQGICISPKTSRAGRTSPKRLTGTSTSTQYVPMVTSSQCTGQSSSQAEHRNTVLPSTASVRILLCALLRKAIRHGMRLTLEYPKALRMG